MRSLLRFPHFIIIVAPLALVLYLFNPFTALSAHEKRERILLPSPELCGSNINQIDISLLDSEEADQAADESEAVEALTASKSWPKLPKENHNGYLTTVERGMVMEFRRELGRKIMAQRGSMREARIRRMYELKTEEDWLRFIEDGEEEGMPILTKFAQRYIYEHQHPKRCEGKKLLVMRKFPRDESFGIGAIAQAVSVDLSFALRTGRILVYDHESPGTHFLSRPTETTCGGTLNCIFHPISSCQPPADTTSKPPKNTNQIKFANDAPVVYLPAEAGTPAVYFQTSPDVLPHVLALLLKELDPKMTPEMMKYWWRAQAAAYILRPNGEAMKELKKLRTREGNNVGAIVTGSSVREIKQVPFPLPDGTWSMHVRHGDKGIEMPLVPLQKYIRHAEKYISANPLSSKKTAYLSTEDPSIFRLALQTPNYYGPSLLPSPQDGWTYYWSEIPRINVGPEDQLLAATNRTELTIKWIWQLMMAVEAEAWVGTRGSGWSRLIDSLRCVWVGSCRGPFLEVGERGSYKEYGP